MTIKLLVTPSPYLQFNTEDKLKYNFFPNSSGSVIFRVCAAHDAHVALCSNKSGSDPLYEILIGACGNTKSVIRKNRTTPDVADTDTEGILTEEEFRGFWLKWKNGTISLGREFATIPLLSWTDPEIVPINYIGVCTGNGSTGSWIVEQAPSVTIY